MVHICVNELSHRSFRKLRGACSAPNHYMNQRYGIVNFIHRNKYLRILNQNMKFGTQREHLWNVVRILIVYFASGSLYCLTRLGCHCKRVISLSWPIWTWIPSNYVTYLQRFPFLSMNVAKPGFSKVICWIYIYIYTHFSKVLTTHTARLRVYFVCGFKTSKANVAYNKLEQACCMQHLL